MTKTITEGRLPDTRNPETPLRQRSAEWLREEGYRYYCRFCDTPHKTRRGKRCCAKMQLSAI